MINKKRMLFVGPIEAPNSGLSSYLSNVKNSKLSNDYELSFFNDYFSKKTIYEKTFLSLFSLITFASKFQSNLSFLSPN